MGEGERRGDRRGERSGDRSGDREGERLRVGDLCCSGSSGCVWAGFRGPGYGGLGATRFLGSSLVSIRPTGKG